MRVAIIGVGNCATRSCRASTTTATPTRTQQVPGLMHVDLGGYHVRDIEFTAAFDIDAEKVGKDLGAGDLVGPEQHDPLRGGARAPRHHRAPRDDPRRPRQVPLAEDHEGARRDRRHRRHPARHAHRRRRLLPAGRLRAGDQVVRRADPRGRAAASSTASRSSSRARTTGTSASRRPACRSSATTSSPRSARRSSTARSPACSTTAASAGAHLAAERRRQHGLLQHARARAPRVQEDLQDQRRHLDHRPRAARRRRPRRPVRLRAVADRPQVGAHPPRGPGVRRRAAERSS